MGQSGHALANGLMQLRLILVELIGQSCERTVCHSTPALLIDDGVAQHAIKPSHRRLVVVDSFGLGDATREGFLQDVFGQRAITDPLLQKPQELVTFSDEAAKDRLVRCIHAAKLEAARQHWQGAELRLERPNHDISVQNCASAAGTFS
jgi:hypothetical protein